MLGQNSSSVKLQHGDSLIPPPNPLLVPSPRPGGSASPVPRGLTCYLRLALRVEGVGHRVEARPGPLGGNADPHPHPLQLTEAVGEQSGLGRVLQFLAMS